MRHPAPTPPATAFSLVEIALALGVVGFALVAILGMVPVAVNAAKESRDETRATFIARTIIETLRSGGENKGLIETEPGDFESIGLPATGGAATVRHFAHDNEGGLIGEIAGYNFATGAGAPDNAVFIARLTLTPQADGLVHVECRVETPAVAARENRASYPFVTLLAP